MLDHLFLQILNMSFTASYVILFVLIVRFFLRKAPKIFSYSLWSVVLFRLLCPFSFESRFSWFSIRGMKVEQMKPFPEHFTTLNPIQYADNAMVGSPEVIVEQSITVHKAVPLMENTFTLIWIMGIVALLIYSVVSLLKLKKQLKGTMHESDNIYIAANLQTPFVMGVFRPQIYLPANLNDAERQYILLHEQTHIRRFDHVVRIISFFMLCLHWFNPFVWLAFFMSAKDMEMSCDESVIKQLGNDIKKDYSSSLLSLATGSRIVNGVPLAFGEGDTRGRIKNVLNYKKPAFWVIIVCIITVLMVCIGLMADPKSEENFQDNGSAEFLKFKTEYVGDISKVSGILRLLPFPDKISYNGLELFTDEPPYAVTVNLKADTETRNYYTGEALQKPFENNALILFALVGNVEYINFCIDDEVAEPYTMQYTRQWADMNFDKDIREFAVSEETFGELLEKLNGTPYKYTTAVLSEYENGKNNLASAIEINELLTAHFETIMRKPKASSSPNDYIKANQETFDEILSYGDSTLLYCYRLFEQGGQTDLKGQLMMAACRSLCTEEDIDLSATTGQDWYDAFKDNAVNMQSKLGEEDFEKHMPKSFLLLQFLNGKTGDGATVRLPHFSYSGDDKILKLVYDTEISRYQNYHNENAFCIPAVRVFNTTGQENKLKVFATIFSEDYVLYEKKLKSMGGSIIPVAITYTENVDGSYSIEEYVQAEDGTRFAPSIKEFCTFPLSGREIPGLADIILNHYSNYEDLRQMQRNNLVDHLNTFNQTGISLITDYDDSVLPIN
ncbi:M56 family metallopeptidase [Anaerovorax sp. IOR16]|uniref:M56 family metallopeptidase n=1 Tax=Anaerovorax sp. IOR16 TaxID=2773458 RepID=UPI0019D2C71D|nr:M56 family metallopeptidase [Anaerovorax sp. IOR16]